MGERGSNVGFLASLTIEALDTHARAERAHLSSTLRLPVFPCAGQSSSSQPEAAFEENGELGFGHAPLPWRHFPLFCSCLKTRNNSLIALSSVGKWPRASHRPAQFGIQRLDDVGNRYEIRGANIPAMVSVMAYVANIRDRGTGSMKVRAGRSYSMSFELGLVAGRLCDLPGCAESADP